MRTLLGGMVLAWVAVCSLMASVAAAQVSGVVDTIGFDGRYRPGCWTPMLVRLQSTGSPTGLYELRVWQHDLDGDTPYYSTRVTLTAGRGEQRFWTYFLPEPIRGGLTGGTSTAAELAQRLRITVHNAAGAELAQVAIGASVPQPVDSVLNSFERPRRAKRFVVFVRDGGSAPPLRDYGDPEAIAGLGEDLDSVVVGADRLPESSLGYDGVDAIVWLEGDPSQLSTGGSRRMEAVKEYVRRGGHLILNTPANWQQLNGFEEMLPVDISGTELTRDITPAEASRIDGARDNQGPAATIARGMPFPPPRNDGKATGAPPFNPWDRYRTPFTIATATARPGTVVDVWAYRIDPDRAGPNDQTPWLARRAFGFGCVSWVGQDLGARELTANANWGWPRVWETVFGTAADPVVLPDGRTRQRYQAAGFRELGAAVLDAMNLSNRATTLVGVTILFFVGYWLLAGPGTFFWLKYRQRATASWFWFGAVALGATAVTLGVVRLVLRGDPQVKHVSLVRINADRNQPSMAISRLGVYVPRDGAQTIALTDTDPRLPSTLSPFPIHPSLHTDRKGDEFLFPAPIAYAVPVGTGDAPAAPTVDFPFRTTQKRLKADWFGPRDERIEGGASLLPTNRGTIAGVLRNTTGRALRNVYVAFRHRVPGGPPTDYMIYVANWNAGDPLDLGAAYNPTGDLTPSQVTIGNENVRPNDRFPVRGTLNSWRDFFAPDLRAGAMGAPAVQGDFTAEGRPVSVPVLSLFQRLPIVQNPSDNMTRADLHRSGLRDWDASNALLAGQLVIVAEARGDSRVAVPVPVPMTIDGEKVVGNGATVYQFVLPLTPIPPAATSQPSTTRASN